MVMNTWHWLSIGALLITFEVLLGTSFFLLWVGLWAFAVAGLVYVYPLLSWTLQVSLFAFVSFVTVWIAWFKLKMKKPMKQVLNKRARRYMHREFVLTQAIQNGCGKIKVDDSEWRVEGPELPIGAPVRVIGVEGTILKVEPVV